MNREVSMHESRPEQQQNKTFRNNGTVGRILGYTYSSTTAVSPFLYCFTMSWWVGGAGGRDQCTVLYGTSAIGHDLHVADRAQGLTGT